MPRKAGGKSVVIPIKMSTDLKAEIERVTSLAKHLTEQAVMKLAIERGLNAVEAMFKNPASVAHTEE